MGPTGHGSRFIDNTAVEQLVELSRKALRFRQGQRDKLNMTEHENCTHAVVAKNKTKLGDVTSLNITSLAAGVYAGNALAYNCVPPTARCTLDIRISPNTPPGDIGNMLDQWCQECSSAPADGAAVTWQHAPALGAAVYEHATTSMDAAINPWYGVFAGALREMSIGLAPQVFPAATDSRFLRALGVRALGFSPMRHTEILLHENDEYIAEQNFVEGIGVYARLIEALGSQDGGIEAAAM